MVRVKVTKNLSFEITRAYPASDHAKENYGFLANFSGILMEKDIPVLAINSLSIKVSRDGETLIGSMCMIEGRERFVTNGIFDSNEDCNGQKGKPIFANNFFPHAHEDREQAMRKKELTEAMTKGVHEAILEFQNRAKVRREPKITDLQGNAAALASLNLHDKN